MNVVFTPTAWQQYTDWQKEEKKIVKKRKACSRRITDEHRLIYNFDSNQNLIIYSCKFHYED